jgi:hypothetical protein
VISDLLPQNVWRINVFASLDDCISLDDSEKLSSQHTRKQKLYNLSNTTQAIQLTEYHAEMQDSLFLTLICINFANFKKILVWLLNIA